MASAHVSLGTAKYPLNDRVALASGAANQAMVIQTVDQAPRTSGWYLDAHLGSSAQVLQNEQPTPYFEPITCGNIGNRCRCRSAFVSNIRRS